ncbi:unnamed protein product [Paramecium primaurelia]|uniref:Opioid growth factor receptor (OGFr) conserved domain-containing protein n=1 Tax=Paramecium primaurelia TaxID=5886 RepID=A0A8S1QHX8_PARPR|nr:unnamed protein product [Paramecium primaurelia]
MKQNKDAKITNQRSKSESNQNGLKKLKQPNYDFHKTRKDGVKKDILYHIEKWNQYQENSKEIKNFYKDLEQDHSFIQWIFPNFFNSMFNSDSYRLTIEERNQMIEDNDIMRFYISNYKMFLRFLGIKWNNEKLELENKNQFNICLQINTHNQLRLRRVLASLSVLGQRKLAIQLLDFIYKECNKLYGTQYYLYDLVQEEQQKYQIDFQSQQDYQDLQQIKQQEKIEKINIDQSAMKSKMIQDPPIKQQDNKQGIGGHSIKEIQQKQGFNKVEKEQQKGLEEIKLEDKTKSNFKNQNSLANKQFLIQKKPNYLHGKYDRAQLLFNFDEVKNNYVQGDLLDKTWVTINLLSNKKVDIQQQ